MATAIGTYATLANVKIRAKIADVTDDAFLTTLCNQANAWIESSAGAGRVLAPISGTGPYLFSGFDAVMDGTVLYIDNGIRSATTASTTLEVAVTTGGTFVTVPTTDYVFEPSAQRRTNGWPALRIRLSNLPTGGTPYFFPGLENIRFTGSLGWPAMPDEVIDIAEYLVVKAYQARRAGQAEQAGPDGYTQPIGRGLPRTMRETLDAYQSR